MAVLIAEVLLSLFAVFGLYAAVLLFALRPCGASVAVAVELRAPLSVEEARALLTVVHKQWLLEGYPVVALVEEALLADEAMWLLLETAVDDYYIIAKEKT